MRINHHLHKLAIEGDNDITICDAKMNDCAIKKLDICRNNYCTHAGTKLLLQLVLPHVCASNDLEQQSNNTLSFTVCMHTL